MSTTLFDTIGGEPVVRRIVDRFYDVMDTEPAAATIRAMHPPDLTTSRTHLHWFLVGWLGGPQLYVERRGHPRLRARHLPFAVDVAARDAWMLCMRRALMSEVPDVDTRMLMDGALERLATHMINQAPG